MYRKFSNALAVTVIASVAWIAYEVLFGGLYIFIYDDNELLLNGFHSFTEDLNILKMICEYLSVCSVKMLFIILRLLCSFISYTRIKKFLCSLSDTISYINVHMLTIEAS